MPRLDFQECVWRSLFSILLFPKKNTSKASVIQSGSERECVSRASIRSIPPLSPIFILLPCLPSNMHVCSERNSKKEPATTTSDLL